MKGVTDFQLFIICIFTSLISMALFKFVFFDSVSSFSEHSGSLIIVAIVAFFACFLCIPVKGNGKVYKYLGLMARHGHMD
jgi:ABC-type Na+ efflux pump permease subunit